MPNLTTDLWTRRNTASMPTGAKVPRLTARLLRRLARADRRADRRGE